MKIRSFVALGALGAAVAGCGSKTAASTSASSGSRASASPVEASSSANAAADTSEKPLETAPATGVFRVVRKGALYAGFVDFKALRESGMGSVFTDAKSELAPQFAEFAKKCGGNPLAMIDAVAFGGKEGEPLVAAKLAVAADKALDCVRGLAGAGEKKDIEGKPGIDFGTTVAVVDGDILFAGPRLDVTEAVTGHVPSDPALVRKIQPTAGRVISLFADLGELKGAPVTEVSLHLDSNPDRLAFELAGEGRTEDSAKALEEQANKGIPGLMKQIESEMPGFPTPTVVRTGSHVVASLVQNGNAEKQASAVGVVSGIAIYAVRRYLTNAKAAEAKNTVGAIARSLASSIEASPSHRCPPSAPPIPNDIPKGTKYKSSHDDWQQGTWKTLGFAMSEPQYYRYRVDTAAGGKKCKVIAEGDLNGDGKSSMFALEVTVDDAGHTSTADHMVIQDELE